MSGPLYYFYMSLLSTFSTNSINILAGLNALEVSQTLIIAISVCINDALYLPWPHSYTFHVPVPSFLVGMSCFCNVVRAGFTDGACREIR